MTQTPYARMKDDLESIVNEGLNTLIKHADDDELAGLLSLLGVHCQEIIIKMARRREHVIPVFNAFTVEMREGFDEHFAVETTDD